MPLRAKPNFGPNSSKVAIPKIVSTMPLAFESGSFVRNEVLNLPPVKPVIADLPIITSISPNTGFFLGGLEISIAGTNFADVLSITVGGISATNIMIGINEDLITAVVPAGTAGPHDVVVITAKGSATVINGFTYTSFIGQFGFNDPINSALIPLAGF